MIRNYRKMKNKNPIKRDNILSIYTDGASRGNPGHAACSFIFLKNGDKTPIKEYVEYLGKQTNNVAEYTAIIKALESATEYTRWKVKVFSDSELVINQLNKDYRVKKAHLRERLLKIFGLTKFFEKVEFFHVPRDNEFIRICDALCNTKLDEIGERR